MKNLLPLKLIFIRTYERDSDKERLREDVLPRFRVLECCDFSREQYSCVLFHSLLLPYLLCVYQNYCLYHLYLRLKYWTK